MRAARLLEVAEPGASVAGRVRPFDDADVPALVDLHKRTFIGGRLAPEELEPFLRRIFCEHPWRRESCPSLVYEDRRGRLVGCLGVMPRPMTFRGRPLLAAVSHHFMVDSDHRSTMAAVHLVRAFLSGPQDLSLAEGDGRSRRLWGALNGATAFLYSLHWTRVLRPAGYAMSALRRHGAPRVLTGVARPLATAVDALSAMVPTRMSIVPTPDVRGGHLGDEAWLEGIASGSERYALAPTYDAVSLQWIRGALDARPGRGSLQRVAVRDAADRTVGWYAYHLRPGETSEVLHVVGRDRWLPAVFDHLLTHAWQGGAAAVSGRLDPSLLEVCAARQCTLRAGVSWMLAHADRRELIDAVHRGDAFLTSLEGERWIGA